ncbi:hypothetical protein QR680_007706 [Steinernema hermaphroditum]|uniref:Uncharacterized protein n=1 Tax=Steinernema hermaphroditum TaxID=289476 RepID=A0AA39M6U0_9BILA|nr:hypothetical protein QR680_007706 [Steinernema hermaphroditum]
MVLEMWTNGAIIALFLLDACTTQLYDNGIDCEKTEVVPTEDSEDDDLQKIEVRCVNGWENVLDEESRIYRRERLTKPKVISSYYVDKNTRGSEKKPTKRSTCTMGRRKNELGRILDMRLSVFCGLTFIVAFSIAAEVRGKPEVVYCSTAVSHNGTKKEVKREVVTFPSLKDLIQGKAVLPKKAENLVQMEAPDCIFTIAVDDDTGDNRFARIAKREINMELPPVQELCATSIQIEKS